MFGLLSLVTILAHQIHKLIFPGQSDKLFGTPNQNPTFSDALALVRRFLWASTFSMSPEPTEMIKVPRSLFERLRDIAVYAA